MDKGRISGTLWNQGEFFLLNCFLPTYFDKLDCIQDASSVKTTHHSMHDWSGIKK